MQEQTFTALLEELQDSEENEEETKEKEGGEGEQRVHAQSIYYQENLAFCFQLCTAAHFVGYLPLPWFSCSLVVFPYR